MRRATALLRFRSFGFVISIHALLAESDSIAFKSIICLKDFYPRSPCGERPKASQIAYRLYNISIHALLAESDARKRAQQPKQPNFYPRSPCGERPSFNVCVYHTTKFLSTLSLRRATSQQPAGTTITTYFYPRSPCGERLCQFRWVLLVGNFYPRSPCGERHRPTPKPVISWHFYPRSPCGERRGTFRNTPNKLVFLSTLSLRRATVILFRVKSACKISIHALLAESDVISKPLR